MNVKSWKKGKKWKKKWEKKIGKKLEKVGKIFEKSLLTSWKIQKKKFEKKKWKNSWEKFKKDFENSWKKFKKKFEMSLKIFEPIQKHVCKEPSHPTSSLSIFIQLWKKKHFGRTKLEIDRKIKFHAFQCWPLMSCLLERQNMKSIARSYSMLSCVGKWRKDTLSRC